MGKFSKHEPQPRDFFRTTDPDAVTSLVPFVRGQKYAEVCYGAGDLEDLLMDAATCVWRSDLDPQVPCAIQRDALTFTKEDLCNATLIITNPPYKWDMLKPLLDHLPTLKPTWLLLPADNMHNKRMGPYMKMCSDVVSVGRLYFHKAGEDETKIKHKKQTANYCWYRFEENWYERTTFWGR